MKKIGILAMFVCGVLVAYSQTISLDKKDYDEMLFDNRNLQNKVRDLQDSIAKITEKHNNELSVLNSRISKLNKDLTAANDKVADLDKNRVKTERDNLQQQVNELKAGSTNLNQQLLEKDRQIAVTKTECNNKAQEQYKAGQQSAFSQIERSYQKSFDNLIKSSSKQSVEYDLPLVDNEAIKKKMQDLQKYFTAKQIFENKYNAQDLQYAKKELQSINQQSELLEELRKNIDSYEDVNMELKNMISKIIEIDKTMAASTIKIETAKLEKVSALISRYIYDYSFNFIDYPYLSSIILKIIDRKQNDVDAEISDLLNRL
jgi:hypothetical protein